MSRKVGIIVEMQDVGDGRLFELSATARGRSMGSDVLASQVFSCHRPMR